MKERRLSKGYDVIYNWKKLARQAMKRRVPPYGQADNAVTYEAKDSKRDEKIIGESNKNRDGIVLASDGP